MTRLPIRIRLTLGFALAMALVLAAVGLFVYQRVSNELLAGIDQALVAKAHEETESGHVDADTGGGTTYAQTLHANGCAPSVTTASPATVARSSSRRGGRSRAPLSR